MHRIMPPVHLAKMPTEIFRYSLIRVGTIPKTGNTKMGSTSLMTGASGINEHTIFGPFSRSPIFAEGCRSITENVKRGGKLGNSSTSPCSEEELDWPSSEGRWSRLG